MGFKKVINDKRGNVAIMFSLSALGMFGFVGLALEYGRATMVKASISAAADAAALAGARDGATLAERKKIALDVFRAGLSKINGVTDLVVTPKDVVEGGKIVGFEVSGSVNLGTTIGRIFGQDKINIGMKAEATVEAGDNIEVALVLDTTGSMGGSKITTLKSSARDLVTKLMGTAVSPDQVKFAVVPFAQYVNIGLSQRNKS